MRKKWLLHSLLAGMMTIPLMGFSSPDAPGQTKMKPNEITLESGGTSVPFTLMEDPPPFFHQPEDGIISGGLGCVPDIHEFSKSTPGEHIVFTAGISELEDREEALALNDQFTIYVEIISNGGKNVELPFNYHIGPDGKDMDPNTGKPFWVSAVFFDAEDAHPGSAVIDLPTGDYKYQFKVKENSKNNKGHVLDVWAPENNTITIVE
ncbi:hypothetical protein [Ammoniphilus resinae]|uniref:Uncharacterized protein n=1 Tax=Ammoniphilus resinae TaxID=861532 RepID=A0ABS4GX52_9BACL|nr:hypothetical protein [Ammoniphilus resinae]MBP1934843.1 hypothetical protein [Ammoniphilus resinae]